jgi:hypothetical protein
MARISMLVPDEALALIDSVSPNRSAFMVEASVAAAKRRKREIEDAEIADICRSQAAEDRFIAAEFEATVCDGIE